MRRGPVLLVVLVVVLVVLLLLNVVRSKAMQQGL
jgi:uncharacterized phage infection (PIP) family protein YhgE